MSLEKPVITLERVTKEFKIPEKKKGIWGKLTAKTKLLTALDDVSFSVQKGEILGYIGPNGSGKSTTIKILTGIITPTQGKVDVLGYVPWKERMTYTQNIGVVFGQKSLLWWDIAPYECFRLYKEIYEMKEEEYQKRLAYLVELFQVEEFMHTPTRKLSLGQRMRCELVAALVHKPQILFLDEPTIGLDAIAKQRMREAILEINEKEKTTVILTTHDMQDIEELATRILILNEGKIIYEGDVRGLRNEFLQENHVHFELEKIVNKEKFVQLVNAHDIKQDGKSFILTVNAKKHQTRKVLDELYAAAEVTRLEVYEPSLDEIIRRIYGEPHQKH
jgi:ABC-2 type transport system ATP-binding protein